MFEVLRSFRLAFCRKCYAIDLNDRLRRILSHFSSSTLKSILPCPQESYLSKSTQRLLNFLSIPSLHNRSILPLVNLGIPMILNLVIITALLAAYRLFLILPHPSRKSSPRRVGKPNRSVAVFLGSGGHTSEALALISALDARRYCPRTYIVSSGDDLSAKKALEFEAHFFKTTHPNHSILSVPRARQVHQSLLTTPISAASSLLFCVYHITIRPLLDPKTPNFADLLILNGPGTCFVLCIAVYINKFLGLQAPYVIYVETFTRVKSLSLSGRLIRPFANKFVTQWPETRSKPLSSDEWFV